MNACTYTCRCVCVCMCGTPTRNNRLLSATCCCWSSSSNGTALSGCECRWCKPQCGAQNAILPPNMCVFSSVSVFELHAACCMEPFGWLSHHASVAVQLITCTRKRSSTAMCENLLFLSTICMACIRYVWHAYYSFVCIIL